MSCCCDCNCGCDCGCDCCIPDHGPFPCAQIAVAVFLNGVVLNGTTPVQLVVPGFGPIGPSVIVANVFALMNALNGTVIPALFALGFTVTGVFSTDGTFVTVPRIVRAGIIGGCAMTIVAIA